MRQSPRPGRGLFVARDPFPIPRRFIQSSFTTMPEYPMELLSQAIERAERLVTELENRKAEAEANPPPLSPQQLQMGKMAMEKALASARRMLVSLHEAWDIAVKDMAQSSQSDEGDGDSDDASATDDTEDETHP